jgi:hypothetical protein
MIDFKQSNTEKKLKVIMLTTANDLNHQRKTRLNARVPATTINFKS